MVSRSAAPRSVRAYARTLWASGTRYRMPACVQFPQPSGEDVGGCAEFALEVAVALRAVEEAADDQERPTLADEFERCGQAVPVVGRHPAGGPAGSVQNGAKWLPSGSSKCRWYMKP